jgi:hypothetical protein
MILNKFLTAKAVVKLKLMDNKERPKVKQKSLSLHLSCSLGGAYVKQI